LVMHDSFPSRSWPHVRTCSASGGRVRQIRVNMSVELVNWVEEEARNASFIQSGAIMHGNSKRIY
jgi:hypothetical protein